VGVARAPVLVRQTAAQGQSSQNEKTVLDGSCFKNYNQMSFVRRSKKKNAMRIISKRRLREFWQREAAARSPLEGWFRVVNDKQLTWHDFHDVKATFGNASLVGDCIVFNIGGNKFRLVVKINYRTHNVFVRAVLTHEEYDKDNWKADCGCE
jgi:mRNA interferase HigB